MIASVIMLILAGNMYYYVNNNQYAIFIGIGGILILNAYSTGNKKKNILNPPEGMTSEDIRHMNAMDLLDMDYFLNDEDTDDVGEEGFYIF